MFAKRDLNEIFNIDKIDFLVLSWIRLNKTTRLRMQIIFWLIPALRRGWGYPLLWVQSAMTGFRTFQCLLREDSNLRLTFLSIFFFILNWIHVQNVSDHGSPQLSVSLTSVMWICMSVHGERQWGFEFQTVFIDWLTIKASEPRLTC